MHKSNLEDIEEIFEILREYDHRFDLYPYLMKALQVPDYYFFNKKGMVIFYEPFGDDRVQVHIYSKFGRRGKDLKDFCIGSGKWLFNNSKYDKVFTFVDNDNLRLRLFNKAIGLKRVGSLGNQIIYGTTKEDWE